MADPRFDTSKDPRFKRVPAQIRRLEVDKRFTHMFKDKSFVETPKVDSRGQRQRRQAGKSKLHEFYELGGNEGGGRRGTKGLAGHDDQSKRTGRRKPAETDDEGESGEEAEEEEEGKDAEDEEASSTEEEDEDDDDDGEPVDSSVWEFAEPDVPKGDASRRLAIMGCDWDHVSAGDLLVMLRTYLSSKEARKGSGALRTGSVDTVRVYPSDYGLEQMAKEAESGPAMTAKESEDGFTEEDEATEMENVRRYQLERMKYHYAVAECDSPATASWLYDHMDGLESNGISSTLLDMRFVPDDVKFPHPPTSEASELPKKYQGPVVQRSTLQASKVKCMWDETPAQRKRDLMKKRFSAKEIQEMDLNAYLASTSEEEGDDNGADALRSLVRDEDDSPVSGNELADSDGKEEFGDMEATFSLQASKLEEELTEKVKTIGSKVHTLRAEEDKPKSAWQQYLDRRKATRKERRAKAKAERLAAKQGGEVPPDEAGQDGQVDETSRGDLELMATDENDDRGFNLRQAQRAAHQGGSKQQRQTEAEGSFKVDVNDPRIARVFSSADFEIDPTNPEFRRSEGMANVLKKKRQRKRGAAGLPPPTAAPAPEGGAAQASAGAADSAGASVLAGAGATGGAGGLQLFATHRGGRAATAQQADADRLSKTAPAAEGAEAPRKKKRKGRQST
mmetsp:Transcript_103626/g.302432  ORF Transcript_103626/g.302432 Transcript_103626/m.302432 type:complete len:677 (+) Transcript_103626:76-2106(+)